MLCKERVCKWGNREWFAARLVLAIVFEKGNLSPNRTLAQRLTLGDFRTLDCFADKSANKRSQHYDIKFLKFAIAVCHILCLHLFVGAKVCRAVKVIQHEKSRYCKVDCNSDSVNWVWFDRIKLYALERIFFLGRDCDVVRSRGYVERQGNNGCSCWRILVFVNRLF